MNMWCLLPQKNQDSGMRDEDECGKHTRWILVITILLGQQPWQLYMFLLNQEIS